MKINNPAGVLYPTRVTNVTASRSLDGTVYQNTNSTPKFMTVLLSSAAASQNAVLFYADGNATPTTYAGGYSQNATIAFGKGSVSFWVLPGHNYRAVMSGTLTITAWVEWD